MWRSWDGFWMVVDVSRVGFHFFRSRCANMRMAAQLTDVKQNVHSSFKWESVTKSIQVDVLISFY
jgi:hypothetical protein